MALTIYKLIVCELEISSRFIALSPSSHAWVIKECVPSEIRAPAVIGTGIGGQVVLSMIKFFVEKMEDTLKAARVGFVA